MRWQKDEISEDIEDRRGASSGGGRVPGGARLGIGGFLVLLVLSVLFKRDFFSLVGGAGGSGSAPSASVDAGPAPRGAPAGQDQLVKFVSFVLDDVQATWARELPGAGRAYEKAKLVLFTDEVRSGCGFAESAMGPFYCPADRKVYIDLGFYDQLRARFGAPGDFAQAYVIAHEVGHHVQSLLGVEAKVREAQERRPDLQNELSVRLELQADCFAGVWAHSTAQRNILEGGDVEEGMGAAAAVGDDRLQKGATGRVNPETWTHGSSKQRVEWFKTGMASGKVAACDTFKARL